MAIQRHIRKMWLTILVLQLISLLLSLFSYFNDSLLVVKFPEVVPLYIPNMGLWHIDGYLNKYKAEIFLEWARNDGWLWNSKLMMGIPWAIQIFVIAITAVGFVKRGRSKQVAALIPVLAITAGIIGFVGACQFVSRAKTFVDQVFQNHITIYQTNWGYAMYLTGNILFLVSGVLSGALSILELYLLRWILVRSVIKIA